MFSWNSHRYAHEKIISFRSFFCWGKHYVTQIKSSKVVSCIQYNKYWESLYVILKLLLPSLWVIRLAGSNKSGMDKVLYHNRTTKISIIKSSSDIYNKELFPVSCSSSLKIWSLSDSYNEDKEKIDNEKSSLLSISDDDLIMDIFVIMS